MIIRPDGTGEVNLNGEVLASFKGEFLDIDMSNRYMIFSEYKIIKAKNDDVIFSTFGNFKYFINLYGIGTLDFYYVFYLSATNPCLSDDKLYEFKRMGNL